MDEDQSSNADLSQEHDETPFHKSDDVPASNIWASEDDEKKSEEVEHDVPAFLRRFRRKKPTSEDAENSEKEDK